MESICTPRSKGAYSDTEATLNEIKKDCLSCRVIGALTCFGASAFITSTFLKRPAPKGWYKYTLILTSGGFCLLGIARAFT